MSKKDKNKSSKIPQAAAVSKSSDDKSLTGITKTGKKVILTGIILIISGFIVLTQTNPDGSNLASILSPLFLVAGYTAVAVGILV
ncbi:MAG: hypothetical protein WC955_10805 [Elusimicrobiota bacterium]